MPGLAHLVVGMFVVIPLMYMARERLHYKVALIFALNFWNGPDSFHGWSFLPLIEGHELFGYLIWAVPLALYYSYLSRFGVQKTERFFKIVDDGKRDVSWRNSYLLCLGGGLFHEHVDNFFHMGTHDIEITPWQSVPFDTFLQWGVPKTVISPDLIIIGFVVMIVVSLLMIYFLSKNVKQQLIFCLAVAGMTILFYFTIGTLYTGGELETQAIWYNFFYLFVPLACLAYVARDVFEHPTEFRSKPFPLSKEAILKMCAAFVIVFGVIFLTLSLIVLTVGLDLVGDFFTPAGLVFVAVFVLIISMLGIVSGIGLFLKNDYCRHLAIFFCILLYFFAFPFAISLFLCEKEVKKMFTRTSETTPST